MRREIGAQEFYEFTEKRPDLLRPLFLATTVPSTREIREGIVFILQPLPVSDPAEAGHVATARARDISLWVHGLNHLLDLLVSNMHRADDPAAVGVLGLPHNEAVDLIIHVNEAIQTSNPTARTVFYKASSAANIDQAWQKLERLSKSVRVTKEIEEFEDERDEWQDALRVE